MAIILHFQLIRFSIQQDPRLMCLIKQTNFIRALIYFVSSFLRRISYKLAPARKILFYVHSIHEITVRMGTKSSGGGSL